MASYIDNQPPFHHQHGRQQTVNPFHLVKCIGGIMESHTITLIYISISLYIKINSAGNTKSPPIFQLNNDVVKERIMCLFFDVLIPKIIDINKLGINEELIQWGDEYFSQEPKKFSWKKQYKLTQYSANEPFLVRNLGYKINLDDFYLYLLDDASFHLALKTAKSTENNDFYDLLLHLINLNVSFHIILHHDDDENVIYKNVDNLQRIITLISENIHTENTLIISILS